MTSFQVYVQPSAGVAIMAELSNSGVHIKVLAGESHLVSQSHDSSSCHLQCSSEAGGAPESTHFPEAQVGQPSVFGPQGLESYIQSTIRNWLQLDVIDGASSLETAFTDRICF